MAFAWRKRRNVEVLTQRRTKPHSILLHDSELSREIVGEFRVAGESLKQVGDIGRESFIRNTNHDDAKVLLWWIIADVGEIQIACYEHGLRRLCVFRDHFVEVV